MKESNITGVRVILIFEGMCLFQLRDDKPTISHPNKWSFVSGTIEAGESAEQAMGRECKEEIGIIPGNLTYLGRSEISACYYAHLTKAETENLVLGEGQEIRFFDPKEMTGLDMTPKLEELVTTYLNNLYKIIAGNKLLPADFGLTE